ncbi:TRAP transporter small permease [Teichococcus vastitatis]|jgi:TRAP-type C4-dicarboxylate transport system permease small subunit|uniref:TRAP transporter small permease protein n=1 Tax=Teichococcus vastitatis TaxID=2307076 RepID=A0ABS9W829_9PROT|nr:TRAP transporter small permease [Pseudoroseomonas vastitatis]MCI0755444.1 TRAP transporter small permease [Pseudoroseomonas vastitatis]
MVDRFNEALLVALALALGLLALLAFAQVIARYLLGAPLTWTEEFIRYALIWSVFLGVGITVRKGMLAAVEVINATVPPPLARILTWISLAISAVFWSVLIVYGWIILGNVEGMRSGALEIPMAYVYSAIPLGSVLALINTLVVTVAPPRADAELAVD